MKTPQENFWKTKFGNKYSSRNTQKKNFSHFRNILSKLNKINSVFEIGTNIGLNLDVIKKISPKIQTHGVEINKYAYQKCLKKGHSVKNISIHDYNEKKKFDLVFTCGVLIHLNPKKLQQTYSQIFKLSKKYILIDEYFNPTPVSITYRGYKNKLFKRDFAKEIMKKYKLKLVDYGFLWKEDKKHQADNTTWFLFKK